MAGTLAFARQVSSYVYELYVLPLTRDLRPAGEPRQAHRSTLRQRQRPCVDRQWSRNCLRGWRRSDRESLAGLRFRTADAETPALCASSRHFPRDCTHAPRLVYTWRVYNVNLWRLDTRTGERRMLIGSTYYSRIPQYSPDGRKIAFQSNRSGNVEVWTCDADGSNCQQLTSFGGPLCGTPRWSPDGRWLALDSRVEGQSEIYVIAADGGTPRRVTTPAAQQRQSRVGRATAVGSISAPTAAAGTRSGRCPWRRRRPHKRSRSPARAVMLRWSRLMASTFYYVKEPGPPGLFRMPVEGGEEKQVLPARFVAGVRRDREGRLLQDRMRGRSSFWTQPPARSARWPPSTSQGRGHVRLAGRWLRSVGAIGPEHQDLMLVENFR